MISWYIIGIKNIFNPNIFFESPYLYSLEKKEVLPTKEAIFYY